MDPADCYSESEAVHFIGHRLRIETTKKTPTPEIDAPLPNLLASRDWHKVVADKLRDTIRQVHDGAREPTTYHLRDIFKTEKHFKKGKERPKQHPAPVPRVVLTVP